MNPRRTRFFTLATILVLALLADGDAAAKGKPRAHGKTPAGKPAAPEEDQATPAVSEARSGKGAASTPVTDSRPGSRDAPRAAGRDTVQHESRIEFDERMVRGQSASGVIYLFQRTPSEFKSIVQVPDSFRPRSVEILAPRMDR